MALAWPADEPLLGGNVNSCPDLNLDTMAVRACLCDFIRRGVGDAGRRRAVLGLSGGIDSALVCYLAAEALGPENVLAVTMPYATSSPASLADALAVVERTGVQREHLEITPIVDPLFAALPDMDRRRKGNAMARARMIILFDRSEAFGGLVLGTSNKTETLLGYSTLYGDSACALAPIGDLYKTQVRQLAADLDVPESIISKPPTADLWPDQTDEADLGLTYAEADAILYLLFDAGLSPAQVQACGYDERTVARICDLVRRNLFKRRLPPVARVGRCTVGVEIGADALPAHWAAEAPTLGG